MRQYTAAERERILADRNTPELVRLNYQHMTKQKE
jgi:hypothetical protein